jgi:hypothetical protein
VEHLLATEELVLFPFAGGDIHGAERGGDRARGGVDREVHAVSIEVVARGDEEIDPDPVRALGDSLDLEGVARRQELGIHHLCSERCGDERCEDPQRRK